MGSIMGSQNIMGSDYESNISVIFSSEITGVNFGIRNLIEKKRSMSD
jgi:hypothetical protein